MMFASQLEPFVPRWHLDAPTLDQFTGMTAQWTDDAGMDAMLEAAEPGYYRQRYQAEWPDCEGWCFYGRCTLFPQHPGCCWAGPPRGTGRPFAHKPVAAIGAYTGVADGAGADDAAEAAQSGYGGYYHDSRRHASKPWLCWS